MNPHPAWLSALQKQQWQTYLAAGLPTKKHERYKYADLAFLNLASYAEAMSGHDIDLYDAIHQHRLRHGESILLVLVNGRYVEALSDPHKLPHDVIVCSVQEALKNYEALIKPYLADASLDAKNYPFANLNAALFTDGLFFCVPDKKELKTPVHLLSFSLGEDAFVTYPRHVIAIGVESQVTLLEEYVGSNERVYFNNIVTTVALSKGAIFDYYKIQQESKAATHIAQMFVTQSADSQSRFTHFSNGALFARDDLQIKLQAPGAACVTSGLYSLYDDKQYVDYHIDILHLAPHSQSEMLYKGVLDNKSRSVFNGRLFVEKDAQKILAYQGNHNLLLSNDAEVYSKPELEIYADDVKCKHGATTGQINRAALFYLQSRGIPHDEAMRILLEGFADEVISRIKPAGIKSRVQEVML